MKTLIDRRAATNSTFAIGGVPCFADGFVAAESSVLRTNIGGKIPPIANWQNVTGHWAGRYEVRFLFKDC